MDPSDAPRVPASDERTALTIHSPLGGVKRALIDFECKTVWLLAPGIKGPVTIEEGWTVAPLIGPASSAPPTLRYGR